MKDHYKTLGIKPNSTAEQIKKAYQKLALKFHPDKNVGNEEAATKFFKEIREAYEILGDAQQRSQYDVVRIRAGSKANKSGAHAAPNTNYKERSSSSQASPAPDTQASLYKEFFNLIRNNSFEMIREEGGAMSQRVADSLKNLINRGLDINTKYDSVSIHYPKIKLNILHMSIIKNKKDLLQFLLNKNVNVDDKFNYQSAVMVAGMPDMWEERSSLELAIKHLDDTELSSRLITDRTDISVRIFDEALTRNKLLFASAIINKAQERGALDSIMKNILHRFIGGNIERLRLLLNTGININAVNESGDTALNIAIRKGAYESIQELLNHGAKVKLMNNKGESPLTLAVEQKDKRSVDMLVASATQQGVLEDVVEFYIEDKSKTAVHAEIASRLTGGGASKMLMQVAEYQKLTALSDLMQDTKVLLPVIDRLRERKEVNMQVSSDLPSREPSVAYSSSSGDQEKIPRSSCIDFDLRAGGVNIDGLQEFYNSSKGQESLRQHNVSNSSRSSRSPSPSGGDRKRSRVESPERK